MTDKQIIINGTDVSECECIIEDYYYQQANNLENGYTHIKNVCELGESGSECYNLFCKDNPNCYYKQLKRKEQECERLKEDRERWKSNFNGKVSVIEELLQQLDQLKVENDKYKQTLAEIKEIAEGMNTECFYNDFDCKDCDMKNGCIYQDRLKILQEIS